MTVGAERRGSRCRLMPLAAQGAENGPVHLSLFLDPFDKVPR